MVEYIIQIDRAYWNVKRDYYVGNKGVATKFETVEEVKECLVYLEKTGRYSDKEIKVIEVTEKYIEI